MVKLLFLSWYCTDHIARLRSPNGHILLTKLGRGMKVWTAVSQIGPHSDEPIAYLFGVRTGRRV